MIIFVEGEGDRIFIEMYLKCLGKDGKVSVCDGKDNLQSCKTDIEKAVNKKNKIKIIFDADEDALKARDNIKTQLEKLGRTNGYKIEYEIFLFPNNKDIGTLESLFEKITTQQKILKCFDEYREKIQAINENFTLPGKKEKFYAYFYCFGIKHNAEDLQNNQEKLQECLDFESKALESLKTFLCE